jgi:hypothetical protein
MASYAQQGCNTIRSKVAYLRRIYNRTPRRFRGKLAGLIRGNGALYAQCNRRVRYLRNRMRSLRRANAARVRREYLNRRRRARYEALRLRRLRAARSRAAANKRRFYNKVILGSARRFDKLYGRFNRLMAVRNNRNWKNWRWVQRRVTRVHRLISVLNSRLNTLR